MDQTNFTTKVFDAIMIPDDFILKNVRGLNRILWKKKKIKIGAYVLPIVLSSSPFC